MADARDRLASLGWDEEWERTRNESGLPGEPARVVRHDGIKVLASFGAETVHATFARGTSISVGDWVLVENETVTGVLDRRSELRRDLGDHGEQIIAANVDTVLLVFGVDKPLRREKVLRFVTFAWDVGAEPVIVLSKIDLIDDVDDRIAELRSWDIDLPVVGVSVETGQGHAEIAQLVRDHTVTLVGESGAGKSSLVNLLMGEEVAWVGDVRESDLRGRHTTTHRELHMLSDGGLLIDNPGVRSLGLAGESSGLDEAFADVQQVAEGCKFRDCAHESEPGCAVMAAVEDGTLSSERVDSYRRLRQEQDETSARVAEADRIRRRRNDSRSAFLAREQLKDDA